MLCECVKNESWLRSGSILFKNEILAGSFQAEDCAIERSVQFNLLRKYSDFAIMPQLSVEWTDVDAQRKESLKASKVLFFSNQVGLR